MSEKEIEDKDKDKAKIDELNKKMEALKKQNITKDFEVVV